MIWQTWRQHRAEGALAAALFLALASAMVVVGRVARARAHSLGLPAACAHASSACSRALEALHQDFHSIPPVTGALIAIPLLAGMFWAGPLISREYEAGTQRLAWTQSVSPRRWITVKIVLIFGVLALAAIALGMLATWTLSPLILAFGGRFDSTWYDVQGIVPVACMLFALGVGVAASALIRRTIPAMAVTLFAYAAARIPIHWIRASFVPVAVRTLTLPVHELIGKGGPVPVNLSPPSLSSADWLRSFTISDSAGQSIPTDRGIPGLIQHYCSNALSRAGSGIHISKTCQATLQKQVVHETIRFQPASHFWPMQSVESAIFLALAAGLIGVAVLAVASRRLN